MSFPSVQPRPRSPFVFGVVIFLFWGMSCFAGTDKYRLALLSGRTAIPVVADFTRLLPNSLHLITYYTGEKGQTTWTSTAGVYGRYELSVQMDITLNADRTKIVAHTAPMFHLAEINRAWVDGRNLDVDPGDVNIDFGP